MRKKILLILLSLTLLIYCNLVSVQKTEAYTVGDTMNTVANWMDDFFNGITSMETVVENVKQWMDEALLVAAKFMALKASQMISDEILGTNSGKSPYVSDWNAYLYLSPQQRTMTYLSSMFTQSTRGRASSLNYEGVGQKYDQYLLRQAQGSISPQPITVNLRDYGNPENVLDGNNFRGLTAFFLPQNNPYGVAMIAQKTLQSESEKQTTLAEKKQTNGFISIEKNGRIISPGVLLQSVFSEMDKTGTNGIINAVDYYDVINGLAIKILGVSAQKAFGDKNSQEGARQQNINSGNAANGLINSFVNDVQCTNKYDTAKCCTSNGGTWKNGTCV